jgi:hypothetical protein
MKKIICAVCGGIVMMGVSAGELLPQICHCEEKKQKHIEINDAMVRASARLVVSAVSGVISSTATTGIKLVERDNS